MEERFYRDRKIKGSKYGSMRKAVVGMLSWGSRKNIFNILFAPCKKGFFPYCYCWLVNLEFLEFFNENMLNQMLFYFTIKTLLFHINFIFLHQNNCVSYLVTLHIFMSTIFCITSSFICLYKSSFACVLYQEKRGYILIKIRQVAENNIYFVPGKMTVKDDIKVGERHASHKSPLPPRINGFSRFRSIFSYNIVIQN